VGSWLTTMTVFPPRCDFSRRRTMRGFLPTTEGERFAGPSGRPLLLRVEKGDCKGRCGNETGIFLLMDGGRQIWQFFGFAQPGVTITMVLCDCLRHLCCGAFARSRIEDLLSQPQGLRRRFDIFVGRDELERALQAHDERGC
jgi:hypothetical protein